MTGLPPTAFLDTVGAGTVPTSAPRRHATPVAAAAPLLAMLAALALVTATGLSQRSGLPEAVAPWFYGFFFDRYPLFAFALVYGVAHLVAVAAGPGPASVPRRAVFGLAGIAVLALAGLYPTFGGLILRGGFATGGMAFLTQQPLWLAYGLGAGIAAAFYGGILGAFAILANRSLRPRLARVGMAALSGLALWLGAALIGLGHDFGLGPWPHRAFRLPEAGLAAALLLMAALPHAALAALREHPAAA